MNIICSIDEISETLRGYAREVSPGRYEIDCGRVQQLLFNGGGFDNSPKEPAHDDGYIVCLPREDARNVVLYQAALEKVGGDRSRLRIT